MMLIVLIIAVILLAYILYTSPARNKPVVNLYASGDWIAPGNGYGRHGYHASKKF